MRYNPLGRTGLFVSEFCIGTMTFGQPSGRYAAARGIAKDEAETIVRCAVDAGINLIDTADVYNNGQSEEIVGGAIKALGIARTDMVIATKFEHATGAGPNDAGGSRHHIVAAVQASLKRLGTDYIDLYQMHGFDPATPVEETLRALDDLVRQGLVRAIGLSNWAAWQVSRALGLAERLNLNRFQSYQGYYSLAAREAEREIVPMLVEEGLGLIVFSPLSGGYLTGKYRDGSAHGRRTKIPFPPVDEHRGARVLAAIDPIAAAHGVTTEAVALAWLRQQPAVTSVILGLSRPEQLAANLAGLDVTLSGDDLAALDEASQVPAEYPHWMLADTSAARHALLTTGQLPEQH